MDNDDIVMVAVDPKKKKKGRKNRKDPSKQNEAKDKKGPADEENN